MKTRIFSAAIIIITSAVLLISQHTVIFTLMLAALAVVGAYEIFRAVGAVEDGVMLLICAAFAGFVPFCSFFDSNFPLIIALFSYISAMLCLILWRWQEGGVIKIGFIFFMNGLISLGFSSLTALRDLGGQGIFAYQKSDSTYFLVLVLVSAWGTDVGGYFVGSFFGKHKFVPSISPKKTTEGVIGGIAAGVVGFLVTSAVYTEVFAPDAHMNIPVILLFGIILSVAAIFGDLAASAMKRSFQIKDFGNLIPGHGGILDRFDSVLFVTPFLYILTQLLPVITR